MSLHKSALRSAIVIGDGPVSRDSRSISPRRTAMSDDDRETPALEQSPQVTPRIVGQFEDRPPRTLNRWHSEERSTCAGTISLGPCAPQRDATAKRSTRRGTNSAAPDQGECGRFRRVGAAIRSDDAGETWLPQSRVRSGQRRLALKPTSTWQHHEMQWFWFLVATKSHPRHPIRWMVRWSSPFANLLALWWSCVVHSRWTGLWGENGQNEGRTVERKRSRRRCVSHCRNLWSNHKLCVREYYLFLLD